VQNAWYAVGVGTAGGGGGNTCNTPAGLTSSSVTSSSATVSWGAVSGALSYNLQYKTSAASTWTTVSGLTSTSYNLTGLTASTTYNYQVQTVCSGGSSAYSAASSFTTSGTGTITYCTTSGTTSYEYINKIVLGSINNTSGNNSGYADYTSLSTTLAAGSTYSISMTPGFAGTSYTEYWRVFIDYNQDGDLQMQMKALAAATVKARYQNLSLCLLLLKNGATRMRIIMHYGSARTTTCGTFTYGEVEDYTVNINGGSGLHSFAAADKSTKNTSITISPNPIRGTSATVNYYLAKEGKTTIKVVDMYGRNIQNINLGNQQAGNHTYTLSTAGSSGSYYIVLEQNNASIARNKFIITR